MDKKKKIRLGALLVLSVLIIILAFYIDTGSTNSEVNKLEVPEKEIEVKEAIKDPYGYTESVDVVEYLEEYSGFKDIIKTMYDKTLVYLYDKKIVIKDDSQYGILIQNDFNITTFDLLALENKIAYIVELENEKTVLYTYDYELDEIYLLHISEGDGVIREVSWIDSNNLLVIVGAEDVKHAIYTFNITDEELIMVFEPLENETFIEFSSNGDTYIGIWIRVYNEVGSNEFKDIQGCFKKEDYSFEFWHRDKTKAEHITEVDSFGVFIDSESYEVLEEYEGGGIYQLNYNQIGVEVNEEKIVLDVYSQSTQLSPDKSKISLVLGEQDAWSGMYIYDIEERSISRAVDASISGAPKEAIWIDNERILFIYGYPSGHYSIGGSIYEYNVITNEKRLIRNTDDNGQELFDLKIIPGMIKVSARTHNDEFTRCVIDSFLIDENYNLIENDPTKLTNIDITFSGNSDEADRNFIIYDISNDRMLSISRDGYLGSESPSSTFIILLALIGIEEGVINPDDSLRKWDGKVWEKNSWNKDHTLKSAIENSVVWYFSEVAKEIGFDRINLHLNKIAYGHSYETQMISSYNIERFWFDGTLSVSGTHQVEFISKLYKEELYFKKEHMELVKELIIQEKSDSYILKGETGLTNDSQNNNVSWFVGYVVSGGIEYAFSTMLTGENTDESDAINYTKEMFIELDILE